MTEEADFPLHVVTARVGDEVSGSLAGCVTQSSLRPVRFLVCVSKEKYTFRVVKKGKALAVHLFGSDKRDMASLFGEGLSTTSTNFDNWIGRRGFWGAVDSRLRGMVEGPIINRMSAGDHEAF